MKIDENTKTVELTRRNLAALIAKLNGSPPNSSCTLVKDGWVVRAVEDTEHYADRAPGELHPDTVARMHGF